MPTQIENIKNIDAGFADWHVAYPWFSMGHLVHAHGKKDGAEFWGVAQKAGIFFNDVQRLNYLLHESPINKSGLLREFNIGTVTGALETPQQVQTRLASPVAPEISLEQHIIEEFGPVKKPIVPLIDEQSVKENEVVLSTAPDIENSKIVETAEESAELPADVGNFDPASIVTTTLQKVDDETIDGDDLPEKAMGADQSETRIRAILEAKEPMPLVAFEPYHTIDYFASLGIKIDIKADDKLGKQLKSFTSWLKTMKRLPIGDDAQTGPEPPTSLPNDHSLEKSRVLTEAMADVLVKQGKKEQAIEILYKLGLLYPEKSPYFAAQIEQLKN